MQNECIHIHTNTHAQTHTHVCVCVRVCVLRRIWKSVQCSFLYHRVLSLMFLSHIEKNINSALHVNNSLKGVLYVTF